MSKNSEEEAPVGGMLISGHFGKFKGLVAQFFVFPPTGDDDVHASDHINHCHSEISGYNALINNGIDELHFGYKEHNF